MLQGEYILLFSIERAAKRTYGIAWAGCRSDETDFID
jgi:hypothetical protein